MVRNCPKVLLCLCALGFGLWAEQVWIPNGRNGLLAALTQEASLCSKTNVITRIRNMTSMSVLFMLVRKDFFFPGRKICGEMKVKSGGCLVWLQETPEQVWLLLWSVPLGVCRSVCMPSPSVPEPCPRCPKCPFGLITQCMKLTDKYSRCLQLKKKKLYQYLHLNFWDYVREKLRV